MWPVVFGVCHTMDCAFTVSIVLVRSGRDSSSSMNGGVENVWELFCFLPLIQYSHNQGMVELEPDWWGPTGPASLGNTRCVLEHPSLHPELRPSP